MEAETTIETEDGVFSPQGTSSSDGSLWIQIEEPLDGEIIPSRTVKVIGEASPETVLTIKDEIIYVQEGPFEVVIPLDMGDNLLEITPSNINGSEITMYLLVTRE